MAAPDAGKTAWAGLKINKQDAADTAVLFR